VKLAVARGGCTLIIFVSLSIEIVQVPAADVVVAQVTVVTYSFE